MDRLSALKVFVRVVETGSFTAVAREMRCTQPTISRAIQELETTLDGRLLHRSTRRVKPTDVGRTFYGEAAQILEALRQAESAVGEARRGAVGLIRVAAPVSVGKIFAVPALAAVLEKNPRLSGELLIGDQYIDLVARGVDVAIRGGPQRDTTFPALRVGLLRFVLVAAPSYLARAAALKAPADLSRHEVISFLEPHTLHADLWDLQGPGGKTKVLVRPRVRTDSVEAVKAAAIAGAGVARLSTEMVVRELSTGELEVVLPGWTLKPFPVQAVFPGGGRRSAAVEAFVREVSARFRQMKAT